MSSPRVENAAHAPSGLVRAFCASVLLLAAFAAAASSVRAVDIRELLEGAELVFEGRVVAEEVRRGAGKRDIFTEVTFEVLDLVKGEFDGDRITLIFSGGSIDGESLVVSDMHRPAVGQHGVYFVESLRRRQVHPLYGWDQGLFVVEPDPRSGEPVVKTRDRREVFGLSTSQRLGGRRDRISDGAAIGLRLDRRSEDEAPMDVERFKQTLRALRADPAP
jgi:hypothetical protein